MKNTRFSAFIDLFTPNTYICVVVADPRVRESLHPRLVEINIANARETFKQLESKTPE